MSTPTVIDLFCGAGGLSLGFAMAGFQLVAALDNDPIHLETHARNFPECPTVCSNAASISGSELMKSAGLENGSLDVLVGGPPCQGFSVGGKRRVEDPRNSLLLEFARLTCEIRPRLFVVENVDGLLMKDMCHHLSRFSEIVNEGGFTIVTPVRILNAMDFGVPQKRKRAIILGYRSGCRPPDYPRPYAPVVTVREALEDLLLVDENLHLVQGDLYLGPLGAAAEYARRLRKPQRRRRSAVRPLTGCQRSVHNAITRQRFHDTQEGLCEPVSRFYKLPMDGLSRALRAGTTKEYGGFTAPRPIHPIFPRCISVREAARLHSFPDWFEFHPTVWHGFRQIGNSVPPLMACAVARTIYENLLKCESGGPYE